MIFWTQTVMIVLDQNFLIPLGHIVLIIFVSNMYNEKYGDIWAQKIIHEDLV